MDQFFFSHAFRGGEEQFVNAAARISRLASLQLLMTPYSSLHEDETHQWSRRDELFEFLKATARGHECEMAESVERKQVLNAYDNWLNNRDADYQIDRAEALHADPMEWDSYFRIDVGGYFGDITAIRNSKATAVESLVRIFDDWRRDTTTFEQDVEVEYRDTARGYWQTYISYIDRMANGDLTAMFTSPSMSMIVQGLMHFREAEWSHEQRMRSIAQFFQSRHFRNVPNAWIACHMWASLKAMVRQGAYANRDQAKQRLSGIFFDIGHIATYAPYCDAIVIDKPMAQLARQPAVGLTKRYGTRVFSRENWGELLAWLDALEASMSDEHRRAVRFAYPHIHL